ncbi:methyltransferase domain-containing protein [Candidatus Dependentiae bacterium]
MRFLTFYLTFGFLLNLSFCICIYGEGPSTLPEGSTLEKLKQLGLLKSDKVLKLHLGCGQSYFRGYMNIDFPLSQHTAQTTSVADFHADITMLSFPENSVDEVRSHHVFEHFDRCTAMALLCNWSRWLKPGGVLVIETPDFQESVKLFMSSNLSYRDKQKVLRHIFGSHEADWAIHCDGWYQEKYAYVLGELGFSNISFKKTSYLGVIKNIIVTAYKKKSFDRKKLQDKAKKVLRDSLVTYKEKRMFNVWCNVFDKYFCK